MLRSRAALLLLVLALTGASPPAGARASGAPQGAAGRAVAFQVIVHPRNPTSSVERRFLANAFLKKVTRWPNDWVIRPVDLEPDSPTRQAFSEQVLQRSVQAVKSYWQQQIFSGRDVPPPELDTDEEVIQFVLKHPAAVGYVSAQTSTSAVKVLTVK